MEYAIIFAIILTFSVTLSIILKKKIEQVIPISVVEIILIVFILGLFDNLKLGIDIIQILTIIQLVFIVTVIIRSDREKKTKEIIKRILTPGLLIYIILFIINILANKNRIFEDYDEFNHWAVIIKNMFINNTYGTNQETIVRFNEYPPFTAVFQYFFLAIKDIYKEDIIIMAQNMLYFSIIIPITKCIKWDKSIVKTLIIVPIIIFVPMIFYSNFFLAILVDSTIGIMFAYVIFSAYEKEENTTFKYLKILSGIIMLCLTKTSGTALAVLAITIILLRTIIQRKKDTQKFKRELKGIITVVLITLIITSAWYIKVKNAEKRWNFNQIIEGETREEDRERISNNFINAIFFNQTITERGFTIFGVTLVYFGLQIYATNKVKDKEYSYYSWAMFLSIPIYMVCLLITYSTIFDIQEAQGLASFQRYTSTILLAYAVFQIFVLSKQEYKNYKIVILTTTSILILLIPLQNIQKKYINGKNYIMMQNTNRDVYTKIKRYSNLLKPTDKILYIVGPKANMDYLKSMIEYEIMPITLENVIIGNFSTQEEFEKIVENYTYVFIYRMKQEEKDKVQSDFYKGYVLNDFLYKVKNEDENIMLEIVI